MSGQSIRPELQRLLDSIAERLLAEELGEIDPTNSTAPAHEAEAAQNSGRQSRRAPV